MTGLVVVVAVFVSGALGAILRRRGRRTDTLGSVRKGDRTETGVNAGFSNHF